MNEYIDALIKQTPLRYNQHQNVEERRIYLKDLIEKIIDKCAGEVDALRVLHGNEQVEYALFTAEKNIRKLGVK